MPGFTSAPGRGSWRMTLSRLPAFLGLALSPTVSSSHIAFVNANDIWIAYPGER